MAVRIYEISKKWGIKSVDLVDRCEELGIEAKSHMSAIEDADVAILAKDVVQRPIKPGKAKERRAARKKAAEKKAAEEKAAAEREAAEEEAAEKAAEAAAQAAAEAEVAEKAAEEKAAEEARAAEEAKAAAEEEAKAAVAVKKREKKVEKKVAAVDEELLKKQQEIAARQVAKELEAESRILRRIVLPPRKKRPRKKRKMPAGEVGRHIRKPVIRKKIEKATLQAPVTVKDLSLATGTKTRVIIRKLMEMEVMANVNQVLEDDVVEALGIELGIDVTLQKAWAPEDDLQKLEEVTGDPEKVIARAPVVTLLGHVDHGKTSLLDKIRHSAVTEDEFGGITQHTGAYRVKTDSGHTVTFLDTPGHEAFTEMRARGANVTDIVILVVAADDGVMPQTVEAINHAKAAGVPIVVAINKIDRADSQPDRVKRQLTVHELAPEDWGGDTIMVEVSAITGEGVDTLLEMLALQAEMMELEASPEMPAVGTIVEARRSEGKGIVATVLVRRGTLRVGDIIVAGVAHGRVRSMTDERGKVLEEAGPSVPVEVAGLDDMPNAGDRFYAVADLQKAREITSTMLTQRQEDARAVRQRVSMENLYESIQASGGEEVKVVVKADVQGTMEVLVRTLTEMSIPEVKVNVIHSGVGSVNDSDILLADASEAIIVGFNVLPETSARTLAEKKGLDLRTYNVIYRIIEDMRAALENRLAPEITETVRGHAEIRETFKVSRLGTIAGCYVTDGVIPRQALVRLARQGAVIYDGRMESLKHFKDDVREVREGFECGIKIAGYDDVKVGDVIEAFEKQEIRRKLPV